jgi:hypothetical protein
MRNDELNLEFFKNIKKYKDYIRFLENFCKKYNFFKVQDDIYRLFISGNNFIEIEIKYDFIKIYYRYNINDEIRHIFKKLITSKKINFNEINGVNEQTLYSILEDSIKNCIYDAYQEIIFGDILKNQKINFLK